MVSPEKTPITSMIRRFTAKNTLHEWQRDNLATPNKDNAVIEGDDRTGAVIAATERVGNYTQLFDKTIITSKDADIVVTAGRASERQLQVAKGMTEVKRDVEAMILSNNAAVAGSSVLARKSAGSGAMIYTNISSGVGGSTPAHTSGAATVAPTAGTLRPFTEALLKSVLQLTYTNSGEMPSILSLTPAHKSAFSAFTGIAVNRFQVPKGQQGTIIGGADVYMGDFGEITVVPNYVQATSNPNTALIINPEYMGLAYEQNYQKEELAKTGHSNKDLVSTQATLVITSEKAHAKVADLTTTGL
jgi:hypothetical protein